MLAIGLIVPLISPFSRELGATPRTLGLLSSIYGVTQLASSPVLGSASDKISPVPTLPTLPAPLAFSAPRAVLDEDGW